MAAAATGTAVGLVISRRGRGPRAEHGLSYLLLAGIGRLVSGTGRVLRSSVGRGVIGVTIVDLLRRREAGPALEESSPAEGSYGQSI